MDLVESAALLQTFERGSLTARLAYLERDLAGTAVESLGDHLTAADVLGSTLEAALVMKRAAGQVNVLLHALGILNALPHLLEPGEKVLALSLGAGNTGRAFDLETTSRVAEFKFTHWRGGPESIRQNQLFKDFFYLAEENTPKRRYLYVVGLERPLRFLQGRRALNSVLSRNEGLARSFHELYGERFSVVRDYYAFRRDRVRIEDLLPLLPQLKAIETVGMMAPEPD